MHWLLALCLALLPTLASAQIPSFPPGAFNNTAARAPQPITYVGAGDLGWTVLGVYSTRAYSAATLGAKLLNVCVSGTCADMSSSASTGDLVSQTINGSVCPNASVGTCKVKTWYELSGVVGNDGNATQATTATQPSLISSATNGRACVYFGGSQQVEAGASNLGAVGILNWVGNRTPTSTTTMYVWQGSTGSSNTNFFGYASTNQAVFNGHYGGLAVTTPASDAAYHAIDAWHPGDGNAYFKVDGVAEPAGVFVGTFDNAGNFGIGAAKGAGSGFLTGYVCEMIHSDTIPDLTHRNSMHTNQSAWFGTP